MQLFYFPFIKYIVFPYSRRLGGAGSCSCYGYDLLFDLRRFSPLPMTNRNPTSFNLWCRLWSVFLASASLSLSPEKQNCRNCFRCADTHRPKDRYSSRAIVGTSQFPCVSRNFRREVNWRSHASVL